MTWHSKTLYFFCFKHSVYGQSTCVFRVTVLTFSYKIQWHNKEFRLKHPGLQLPNALLTYCKLSRIMVPNAFYSQTYDAFENLSPGPEVSKWLEWHSLQFSEVPNFECSFFFFSVEQGSVFFSSQSNKVPIIEFSVFQMAHFSFKLESTILTNLPTKTFFQKLWL